MLNAHRTHGQDLSKPIWALFVLLNWAESKSKGLYASGVASGNRHPAPKRSGERPHFFSLRDCRYGCKASGCGWARDSDPPEKRFSPHNAHFLNSEAVPAPLEMLSLGKRARR